MNMSTLFITILLSFMPISELRGAIPFALANGLSWPLTWALVVPCNILVTPVAWLFLTTVHKLLLKLRWYKAFYGRIVLRTQKKIAKPILKWGWFGLALFVAVPLPITGAWTGALGAWLLGISKRKAMLAISIGVIIAAIIVSLVVHFGIKGLDLFIKNIA